MLVLLSASSLSFAPAASVPERGASGAVPLSDASVAELPVATATVECASAVGVGGGGGGVGGVGGVAGFGSSADLITAVSKGLATNPSPTEVYSKVPFGYAQGAICVELPKRQRTTVTSVMHSPRVASGR